MIRKSDPSSAAVAPTAGALDETQSNFLLANGSSGGLYLTVDESQDGTEWYCQIEWPSADVQLRLPGLEVIPQALIFLESKLTSSANDNQDDSFALGHLGREPVVLRWDAEEPPRCYLVIGSQANSMVFLTLLADQIAALIEALRQVLVDLPSTPTDEELDLGSPE
jgi:hypothetical protein